jgi:uncharacterized linocin/CFP29 family protein
MSKFIYNEQGKLDLAEMRTNSTLPTDAYKFYDDKLVKVAKQELRIVQDCVEAGLVDNSLNLGDTIVSYDKLADMSEAEASMDGITRSQNGALTFNQAGVPVPVYRKDFELDQRRIQAVLGRGSMSLPTTGLELATRKVAEKINSVCWNGFGKSVNGMELNGLRNSSGVNTKTAVAPWGGGSENPMTDIQEMIKELQTDGYGFTENSCILYVSPDNWGYIDNDYSTAKGEKTYKQRFEAFAPIRKVELGSGLGDGECILVEMRSDVLELKVAQDITFYELPQVDPMLSQFSVIGSMALIVKSDYNGNSGVAYLTGA